ncbi:MAG: F0F1 ATP synthase subunit delta [Clostridioides sp.]|jgi:F-type H+-transporting ATPase subunit delta|nr:F0F1 ATP synthase subunit delta [Clostridioides sp.]
MINLISNRYAVALFEIGEEDNVSDKLFEELTGVIDVINSNVELMKALKSPLVTDYEKKNLIKAIFANETSKTIQNFLCLLVDKKRFGYILDIQEAFKGMLNEKNNVLEGNVISAIPMSELEIKELEFKLSTKYDKNVVLENIVDETILGGVLVRLGNEEIDGTVKSRLDGLREELSKVIS